MDNQENNIVNDNNQMNNNPNNNVSVNDVNAEAIDPLSIFGGDTTTDTTTDATVPTADTTNVDTQTNVANSQPEQVPTEDSSNDLTPLGETIGQEFVDTDVEYYDDSNTNFYEDDQSNSNKSINNPTDLVGNYNQSNGTVIDDSEGISSYEDQLNNSQDISLYTQQSAGRPPQQDMNYDNGYVYNNDMNYDNGYVYNDDMNNYDNGYVYNDNMNNYDNNMGYDNGYNNGYDNGMYNNGYDNGMYDNGYGYSNEFSNPEMYGNGDTVAYNNSGYSDYGNNFDALNSGGYDMNNSFNNGFAGSYARPNNNFVNFTMNTNTPMNNQIMGDGINHPKTIGTEAFQKKMKDNNRPFNFMLVIVYGIIIAVIGYFAYNLWLDKNSFNFSKDKMNLVMGYNYEEIVYVKGKVDDNSNYEWRSNDDSIATVNGSGKITGKSEGTVTIIVKSKKTKKEKKVTVNVINPEIKQFTISPNEKVVYIGNTYTIIPLINGQSSLTLNMDWESSNENVATVSSNGVVTPKSKGTTKITVTIPKTSHKATITIIVTEKK